MSFVINKDVLYAEIGPESLLLDRKTHIPYVLNRVAAVVFQMLRKQMDDRGMAQELCKTFEVTPEKALEDVKFFKDELLQKGLLVRSTSAEGI